MTNADRISELYKGEVMPAETQRAARDRVDWLVAQARGDVLDIGCSQGIASFLCARRGLSVLGIDVEDDRIDFAIAERERKPPEVAARVEFRVADATDLDAPDDSFDAVLFGEVLEHLADPRPMLTEIARVCKPDGVIAITTPFGVFPHQDHDQTFFLASLIEALRGQLTVEQLDIVDGYFRVVARPRPMPTEYSDHLLIDLQPFYEERLADLHGQLHKVKIRRKRMAHMAHDLDKRLKRRRDALRILRWRRRVIRRSRWFRLGGVLSALARHPGRIVLLPRDLVRASRTLPPPRRPRRSKRLIPRLKKTWERSSKHAELAISAPRDLRVEIPEIEIPAGPVARPGLKVAVILDRFSSTAFRYEWEQVDFGPDDWRETVERERPDLLFVESAWRGNDDRWRDAIVGGSELRKQPLAELVAWFGDRDLPAVFWSKEDPPNFGHFVDTAKLFEHTFTVDGDCIPRYAEILGHERTQVLPFGAQPRIHNPISVPGGRAHEVAFAGSYYAGKHRTRREQMKLVLDPAREFDLHVFSRILQGIDERFDWPPEYQSHLVGSLPYERMLAAYKAYKVFLNVNSVTESPTMCARRIFELSACSTPVVSGYSRAIEELFAGLVTVSRSPEETRAALTELLGDSEAREQLAHRAMREVLTKHTYGHRVDRVLATVGLGAERERDTVSVLLSLSDPALLSHALAQIGAQAYRPLELVVAASDDAALDQESLSGQAAAAGIEAATVVLAASEGGRLNRALDAATGDLIAVFDQHATYEEHYLTDLIAAFTYVEAPVVGKAADREHAYVDRIHDSTLVARGEIVRRLRFDEATPAPVEDLIARVRSRGERIYSADRFSFAAAPSRRETISASASGARSGS